MRLVDHAIEKQQAVIGVGRGIAVIPRRRIGRIRIQVQRLSRQIEPHHEAAEQRQRNDAVDAVQQAGIESQHAAISQHQVAHLQRSRSQFVRFFLRGAEADQLDGGSYWMAGRGGGALVQHDMLRSAVQQHAQRRAAIDAHFEE